MATLVRRFQLGWAAKAAEFAMSRFSPILQCPAILWFCPTIEAMRESKMSRHSVGAMIEALSYKLLNGHEL